MPLPCELPLSGSSSNPVSLPGAIAALSAQVTSTMLEVRQEIGELKCEMVVLREIILNLAISTIDEQVRYLKQELEIEYQSEQSQFALLSLASGLIKSQTVQIKLQNN
jgi:hypothetical protein